MMNVEELQHVPVERHDQPAQEGSAERLPLLPGRGQRWIQQEKRQLFNPSSSAGGQLRPS